MVIASSTSNTCSRVEGVAWGGGWGGGGGVIWVCQREGQRAVCDSQKMCINQRVMSVRG